MARKLLFYNNSNLIKNENPIEHSSQSIEKQNKTDHQANEDLDLSLSNEKLPESFSVSIIMESQPSSHPWADSVWDANGIVVSDIDSENSEDTSEVKIIEQGDVKQFIYSGMKIRLFLDECESYYHNMMSPEPGCFIVARNEDEDGEETDIPIPVLATLSFDEAHSYLEGDDIVYAVPIPPELYVWAEAFVLDNYVAEKRLKRKRVDWKKGDKRNSSSHAPAFDGPSLSAEDSKLSADGSKGDIDAK